MHSIYDKQSGQRINHPGDIYISSRCWIGKSVTILKGAIIESGAIIGTMALVSAGRYEKDAIYGGVPAKRIRGRYPVVSGRM
jgi:acetyltransferase-like isoleucine patch superfamily enzyme